MTTTLTPADLDNLTALAEAATAGDWRTWNDGHVGSPDFRIGGIFMPTEGSDPAQWMHDARFTAATDPPTVLALVAALQEARAERLSFTARLGFGDDVTEPAASLAEMVDPIEQAFHDAREFHEVPRLCEGCGEWLASEMCEHCHGGGCLPNTQMAYQECDWCAGVGKVHRECAETSYADLAKQCDEARAMVAAGLALADDWAEIPDHGMYGDPMMRAVVSNLRAALTTPTESETP